MKNPIWKNQSFLEETALKNYFSDAKKYSLIHYLDTSKIAVLSETMADAEGTIWPGLREQNDSEQPGHTGSILTLISHLYDG